MPWLERIPARLRSFSAHNVEADVLEQRGFPDRWIRRMARLERDALRRSDVVVTCTEDDGRRLRSRHGGTGPYVVIPNGHDLRCVEAVRGRGDARADLGLAESELAVVFVGSDGFHNEEPIRFLVEDVMPELPRHVVLLLAGRGGVALRPDRVLDPRVRVLGHVADLGHVLAAADLAVNPIRDGSGSNLKMAAYLGAGLPVVTTRVGARGFEDYADYLTVVDLADTAAAITRECHGTIPRRLTSATTLSWPALGKRLYDAYRALLEQ